MRKSRRDSLSSLAQRRRKVEANGGNSRNPLSMPSQDSLKSCGRQGSGHWDSIRPRPRTEEREINPKSEECV
jgi:hypothetical protein